MQGRIAATISWALSLWACWIFLNSLPYKFTGHPDTEHIFGTIGAWIGGILGAGIGRLFASLGPYGVGLFELATSLVLLAPALIWVLDRLGHGNSTGARARWHRAGGAMAAVVMAGAVFFHLATPLGIEVLHQGQPDGGSLFYAAVSVLASGVALFVLNAPPRR